MKIGKKATLWICQATNWWNLTRENRYSYEREISREKTESILIAAQNSVIRINYIKGKIDDAQQNNKCRSCGDKDETINQILNTSMV